MDDVEFYERQVKFQENLAKIQQKRSLLEQEFFNLTKTDKKLQSVRTTKLRSYWKKICEREKRAQERNEALLRDVQEFEERLSKVAADTAKLEKIKEKCENELTKIYPQWRYEVDLTKAKRQLEDGGVKLETQFAAPPTLSSILNASRSSPAAEIDAPLFKLVPYNFERDPVFSKAESPAATEILPKAARDEISSPFFQPTVSETKPLMPDPSFSSTFEAPEKSVVADSSPHRSSLSRVAPVSRPTTSSKELQSLLRPETSEVSKKSIPLLKDPPDDVSTSSFEDTSSEAPYIPPLELKSLNRKEVMHPEERYEHPQNDIFDHPSKEPDRHFDSPQPISPPFHQNADSSDVHQVEINETKGESFQHPEDNFLSDLSDVSSVSSNTTPPAALEEEDSEGEINLPEMKPDHSELNEVLSSQTVPKTPSDILSPKTSEPIKIPIPTLESIPSESIATTLTEPSQKAVPLTSNPAYQNMIRSSEMSSTFGMSRNFEEEDDDDELDKMVSPKPKDLALSSEDDEDDDDDDIGDEKSFSNSKVSDHLSSSKTTLKKPSFASSFTSKKQKAPWDTDSGEEDSYKIPKAGQTLSADEDDFDFYD